MELSCPDVSNSPIRFFRVMDPPMVPHTNVRRAGVVAQITLKQLLQTTIYDKKKRLAPACPLAINIKEAIENLPTSHFLFRFFHCGHPFGGG